MIVIKDSGRGAATAVTARLSLYRADFDMRLAECRRRAEELRASLTRGAIPQQGWGLPLIWAPWITGQTPIALILGGALFRNFGDFLGGRYSFGQEGPKGTAGPTAKGPGPWDNLPPNHPLRRGRS